MHVGPGPRLEHHDRTGRARRSFRPDRRRTIRDSVRCGVRMKVPRYNYRRQFGETFPQVLNELGQMLLDGRYVLSGEVSAFETAFAGYLGVRHVRGVNSGTDAI